MALRVGYIANDYYPDGSACPWGLDSRLAVEFAAAQDDRLAVVAKWVFWVIQARTLLRARFDSRKPESGEGGETETDDAEGALEDMVLGEWAEELEVGLQDLGDIYNDPTRWAE